MADIKIDLRGLSLVEVCKNYPEQVAAAIEQHHIDDQKPSTNNAMDAMREMRAVINGRGDSVTKVLKCKDILARHQ